MKIERTKYVLIDGTDMAGKTTAAKNFVDARSDEWEVRHNTLLNTPNTLSLIADDMVESGEYNRTTINLAYAASILADIDMFAWPRVNTIQESTSIVRSIGHAHINNDRHVEAVLVKALERFPEFDHSFYLTADKESRLARLAMRANQSENDRLIIKDSKRFFAIEDIARSIAVDRFDAQVVDTSRMTEREVQEILEQEVLSPKSGA